MSVVRRAWNRLTALFNRQQQDDEFDEEVRSHIALAADDYVASGMSRTEAERLARRKFGLIEASRDLHLQARGWDWIDALRFDARQAVRGLRRDPGFTIAAMSMLAVTFALNTTVFTIMGAMLYRGFPLVQRNDRLLYLQEPGRAGLCCISYPDFERWRTQSRAFEQLAFVGSRPISLTDRTGVKTDLSARTVSPNTFSLLGVAPAYGRDFVAADEVPGAPQAAILSHQYWVRRFAKAFDVIGSTVEISGAPATIVGVMPEGFEFPSQVDLWMPVVQSADLFRRGLTPGGFIAVGRLRNGVAANEARAELETIGRQLATEFPETNRELTPRVIDYAEFNSGPDARTIWGSLWVGSCLVLLIACANVANLALVRSLGRRRELLTKLALGAGHVRMIRQAAMDAAVLTALSAVPAWWLVTWSVHLWATLTWSRHQILDYSLGAGTLAYLGAITAISAALTSTAPMLRLWRLTITRVARSDTRGATDGARNKHLSAVLVATQIALAIVLLSGAGILVRSLANIVTADTGVREPERVLVGLLRMPTDQYPDTDARLRYLDSVRAELQSAAGIEAASAASGLPITGGATRTFDLERGRDGTGGGIPVISLFTAEGYFDLLGAPIRSGRDFSNADRASSMPVAIVNESFAGTYWPGEQAVGKHLRWTSRDGSEAWRTVVGVAPNIMQGDSLRQHFKPVIYTPLRQETPARATFFLARSKVDATRIAPTVRSRLRDLDAHVVIENLRTLQAAFTFDRDAMDLQHSELGKHASLAPVFAGIATFLAAVGLIAVLAHVVRQRTREIGVRIAIGAIPRDINLMIIREGLRPVTIGLIVGLAASLAANRVLQSQLVNVSPYDPLTLIGGTLVLLVVALIACHIPARRAMRVDPAIALRDE
jgi:putative ABC transport system permease protein